MGVCTAPAGVNATGGGVATGSLVSEGDCNSEDRLDRPLKPVLTSFERYSGEWSKLLAGARGDEAAMAGYPDEGVEVSLRAMGVLPGDDTDTGEDSIACTRHETT